jgi:hypothetical protein
VLPEVQSTPEEVSIPLPYGWHETWTEDGYKYYYNSVTNETTWEIPTEPAATSEENTNQTPLPDGWEQYHTEDGAVYYYNHNTGVTAWEIPSNTPSEEPAPVSKPVHHRPPPPSHAVPPPPNKAKLNIPIILPKVIEHVPPPKAAEGKLTIFALDI